MRSPDTLISKLKTVERNLLDIKNASQFSGTSSVVSYVSETSNIWDVDSTVNTSTGDITFYFVFTSNTQKAPFVSFHPSILVGGAPHEGLSDVEITTNYGFVLFGSPINFEKSVGFLIFIRRSNTSDFDLKIKMKCIATDTGSITVASI